MQIPRHLGMSQWEAAAAADFRARSFRLSCFEARGTVRCAPPLHRHSSSFFFLCPFISLPWRTHLHARVCIYLRFHSGSASPVDFAPCACCLFIAAPLISQRRNEGGGRRRQQRRQGACQESARRTNKYGTSAKERGEIFLFSRQRMGGQEEGFREIRDERERTKSRDLPRLFTNTQEYVTRRKKHRIWKREGVERKCGL